MNETPTLLLAFFVVTLGSPTAAIAQSEPPGPIPEEAEAYTDGSIVPDDDESTGLDPRMFSVSVGTALGVSTYDTPASSATSAIAELGVRVRGLYALGVDLSVNLTGGTQASDQIPAYRHLLRLSGLVYILPLEEVSVVLLGGMGAGEAGDFMHPDGATTSYHAGIGLEVPVYDHIVVGGEYLMIVPGVGSVEASLERRFGVLRQQITSKNLPPDSASALYNAEFGGESAGDYVGPKNFELWLSLRYVF